MTWWASAYFAAYLTFSLWSLTDDLKTKDNPQWYIIADVIADLCLVAAALSYWLSPLREMLKPMLLGIFTIGAAVFLGLGVYAFMKHIPDPELSFQGNVFVAVSVILLVTVTAAPLLFWGFQVSIFGNYAGA